MEFVNKFFALILGVVLCTSCTQENPPISGINIDAAPILRITKSGEVGNFLSTINTNSIELYYKNNGVLSLLTYPGDFYSGYQIIYEPQFINEKMIKVFCYIGGNNNHEETYIKWSPTDIDTLSYDITRYPNGSIVINYNTLKFNNVTMTSNNQNGIFDVVKN